MSAKWTGPYEIRKFGDSWQLIYFVRSHGGSWVHSSSAGYPTFALAVAAMDEHAKKAGTRMRGLGT